MAGTRILVVEDESVVGLDIRNRLMNLGYQVVGVVQTGEEAIRQVASTRPDLVLMDVKLKGRLDGVEVAREIRRQVDIPIVYLTAYADELTLQRVKASGPFGYLLKPVEEHALRTAIEIALYRHEMQKQLVESERWLATTLDSIGEAVIATDAQGLIKFMNPVAERLTGWAEEAAIGLPWGEIIHITSDNGEGRPIDAISDALLEGMVKRPVEEFLLITRDEERLPVRLSVAPIRDEVGNILGVVVVCRDITATREAEDQLRQYAAELRVRNEELDAFAHTVAHDIQNPLNLVLNYSELLLQGLDPEEDELREGLDVIARSARKIRSITEELMLLAGVRQVEAVLAPLDMASIVAEALERLSDMISEFEAEIIVPDEWPYAVGYGPWVEEIWVNYLSNAIKYGGRPPVVELGAVVRGDGMVEFWVRDNGPGLTSEEQAQLFTPFTKLSQVRASGSGLGLSIVRRIAERLGGEVDLKSEGVPGRGSVFSFTLPELS